MIISIAFFRIVHSAKIVFFGERIIRSGQNPDEQFEFKSGRRQFVVEFLQRFQTVQKTLLL